MPRHFKDWLQVYVDYASFSEAPRHMHYWTGVSTIAGALRRRVWIDMAYFKWTPCFYVILVAPPGIVSKSTTAAIGMDLLRRVPGINFGPQVVTWPALVTAFAGCTEAFEIANEIHSMCALTLESSEFGNLINPQDREMVDLLVALWDSKQGAFTKKTKGSGTDTIENPWINLIACTTPAWIAGNFPEYMIGGGFTSRCLFVYADTKDKLVAYPARHVPVEKAQLEQMLVDDLVHIASELVGPYNLSPAALEWGEAWYKNHYEHPPALLSDERFGGYLARKQTHLHKLALVIAASQRDARIITDLDLAEAETQISSLEKNMPEVFSKIGRSSQSVISERFLKHLLRHGAMNLTSAFQYLQVHFPGHRDYMDIYEGLTKAGLVGFTKEGLLYAKPPNIELPGRIEIITPGQLTQPAAPAANETQSKT